MKQVLVLISIFMFFTIYPDMPTLKTLNESIQQHNLIKFKSEYSQVTVPLELKDQLRRLAMKEEIQLLEYINEQNDPGGRIVNAGAGMLCLCGSAIAALPSLIAGAVCIRERSTEHLGEPDLISMCLLSVIYTLAQWSGLPTSHTPDAVDRFFGVSWVTYYLVCLGTSILLGYQGTVSLAKALTSKTFLEKKLKNIRQIIRIISDSINEPNPEPVI